MIDEAWEYYVPDPEIAALMEDHGATPFERIEAWENGHNNGFRFDSLERLPGKPRTYRGGGTPKPAPEKVEHFRQLYLAGVPMATISKALGVSYSAINAWRVKLQLPPREPWYKLHPRYRKQELQVSS